MNMTVRHFCKLVELRTKIASLLPFLLGSLYAIYRFHSLDGWNFVLMLLSLLAFDMATTVLNNYYDFRKAAKREGYGFEEHNPIGSGVLKESTVLGVLITLLLIAVVAGATLFLRTNLLVLLLGGLSFGVGILYSFGPVPISRMPLGELFSGLFMGFVITFVSTYIHTEGGQLAELTYHAGQVNLTLQLDEILLLFFVCLPAILSIANIMLANNICDMEEDVENRRYTLPVYIGRRRALVLFRWLYYATYLDLIVLLLLHVHLYLLVLLLLTLLPLHRNIRKFEVNPSKRETFKLSVSNFVLVTSTRAAILLLCIWIP